jgi:hypothetical protein
VLQTSVLIMSSTISLISERDRMLARGEG